MPMQTIRCLIAGTVVLAVTACTRSADPSADTLAQAPADTRTAPPVPATPAAPRPAERPATLAVTERGIGPVHAGMTIAEASAAVDGALTAPKGDPSACGYAQWRDGPAGVRVMTEAGRIARIEVGSGTLATDAGARIGDSEQRIDSLYRGRVTSTPHKYTKGHYLTVQPAAPADSAFRLVFETDGGRVTKYRAGRRPAVEYVEGCA